MSSMVKIDNVRGYIDDRGVAQLNLEDVARGLGFTQAKNGVEYVRWETVVGYIRDFGFSQQVGNETFIPENIFYRLAMKAKNATAEVFQAKVADEILPSIRKHGAYMTPEVIAKTLLNPDFIISLAQNLKAEQEKVKKLEAIEIENKPKVIFADSVNISNTTILVGELAKILKQNGHDIGQNRLFSWLRDSGYLMKNKNIPTQIAMDKGLFAIEEYVVNTGSGMPIIKQTTKITGRGQIYFVNKFIGKQMVGA